MISFLLLLCGMIMSTSASFKQITDQAAWSARTGAGITYIANRIGTFSCYDDTKGGRTTIITLDEYVMIYGGTSIYMGQSVPTNDVWVIGMTDLKACFAAGITVDGVYHSRFAETSFTPLDKAATASSLPDPVMNTVSMYVAGGLYTGVPTNQVWSSRGFANGWSIRTKAAPWSARYYANLVVDSTETIFIMGGISSDSGSVPMNDVWYSDYLGYSWKMSSSNAAWDPRLGAAMLASAYLQSKYQTGGYNYESNTFLNDVWQVADASLTFKQLTNQAPWAARKDHSMVGNTTIALLAGSARKQQYNDVWITTDQQTWKLCVKAAEFTARSNVMSFVDASGRVWIIGGADSSGYLSDIWTSSWTLDNPICDS